jgi:hypothetical protein
VSLRSLARATLGLALVASPASADIITGQVVDSNGFGVANVNINAKNNGGGGDPTLFNDGTDVNGFFTTTIPAGNYDIIFLPPAPPTTTHLVETVENVTVVGTKDMGTIVLPPGVSVSGSVVNTSNVGIAGVNLDVYDSTSKEILTTLNDMTGALGEFSVAVPASPIELRFDATTVPLGTYASKLLELSLGANSSVGNVQLAPGLHVTGTVQDSNNQPKSGVDLDFSDSTTGTKQYTPGDNSDASGGFDVVVAAGTYDIEFCPPAGQLLVGALIDDRVVAGATDLGSTTLQNGVVMTGTIKGYDNSIQVNADVDVVVAGTSTMVVTCSDNTNGSGVYSVVVPTGNFDVTFRPADYTGPYGADLHSNVAVGGTTVLNGTLPSCPFPTNFGMGIPGTGGFVPHLATSGGAPRAGNADFAFELSNGKGGGTALLFLSLGQLSVPVLGGTLYVDIVTPGIWEGFVVILGGAPGVGGAGSASFLSPAPLSDLVGFTVYGQIGVLDTAAVKRIALSDAVQFTVCL